MALDTQKKEAILLGAKSPAYKQLPLYLTTPGLKKSERRNIALFRIQATQYVATHAGFRDTEIYGKAAHYQRRYCIWDDCTSPRLLDDSIHVLLHCPLHARERVLMLEKTKSVLTAVGLHLDDIPADIDRVRFLLGSPPAITLEALGRSTTAYRDVLRASAAYLRAVYDTRWVRGHKHNQRLMAETDGTGDGTGGASAAGS